MAIYFVLSIERAPFPLTRFVARQVDRFSEPGIDPVWVINFRTRGPGREPRPTQALFLTGPERGKRSPLGRRHARAVAQRRRRCPPLAPGGGNGKGGEPNTLLPQANHYAILPPGLKMPRAHSVSASIAR